MSIKSICLYQLNFHSQTIYTLEKHLNAFHVLISVVWVAVTMSVSTLLSLITTPRVPGSELDHGKILQGCMLSGLLKNLAWQRVTGKKLQLQQHIRQELVSLHTTSMIKFFWSHSMAPWVSAAALRARWKVLGLTYNWRETRDKRSAHSYAAADVHGAMGCNQKCFTQVWRWH